MSDRGLFIESLNFDIMRTLMSTQTKELLGTKIDRLAEFKSQKKLKEQELKSIEALISEVEVDILRTMELDQTKESKSLSGHKVYVSEETVGNVEDWDQVYGFIHENNYYHLLQKRLAITAYRELLSLGRPVPGVLPCTLNKLKFSESKEI